MLTKGTCHQDGYRHATRGDKNSKTRLRLQHTIYALTPGIKPTRK